MVLPSVFASFWDVDFCYAVEMLIYFKKRKNGEEGLEGGRICKWSNISTYEYVIMTIPSILNEEKPNPGACFQWNFV